MPEIFSLYGTVEVNPAKSIAGLRAIEAQAKRTAATLAGLEGGTVSPGRTGQIAAHAIAANACRSETTETNQITASARTHRTEANRGRPFDATCIREYRQDEGGEHGEKIWQIDAPIQ